MIISIYLGEQNDSHMVEKYTLFNDYIWSIGYYLNLQTIGSHEVMFPTFIEHILDVNDDSDSDSKIVRVFTLCFKVTLNLRILLQ